MPRYLLMLESDWPKLAPFAAGVVDIDVPPAAEAQPAAPKPRTGPQGHAGFNASHEEQKAKALRAIDIIYAYPNQTRAWQAKEAGLCAYTISCIANGRAWSGLPRPWLGNRSPSDVLARGQQGITL